MLHDEIIMAYNPKIHNRRSIRLKGYDYSQEGLYFITTCCQNMEYRFGSIVNEEMNLNEFGKIAFDEWMKLPDRFPNFELDVFQIMPNHMHAIIALNSVRARLARAPDNGIIQDNIEIGSIDNLARLARAPNDGNIQEDIEIGPIDNLARLARAPYNGNIQDNIEIGSIDNSGPLAHSHNEGNIHDGIDLNSNEHLELDHLQSNHFSAMHVSTQHGPSDIMQPDMGQPRGVAPTNNLRNIVTIGDIVGAYKSLVANACLDIYKSRNEFMGKLWQRNYYERIIRDEQSYQNISNYIINNPAKWKEDKFFMGLS